MPENPLDKKEPKPAKGHKDHLKEPFLKEFHKIGFIYATCEKIGIDPKTVYRWRQNDEKFSSDFNEAQNKNTEVLERVAMTRAIRKSDLLMIFLLKSLNPQKYKERFAHELDTKTVEIIVTQFINAIKKHAPDFCPHCKSHLGLPDKISKELDRLSASLAGVK